MKRWDIFCAVVDNFGDIGVSWRLARQLAGEHSLAVRLWVDDLESFRPLCPEIDPGKDAQRLRGVEIRRWAQPFPSVDAADVADVVIEAFACELPEPYLAAMAAKRPRPAWINLEYLSAERWVEESHGLPSPHPRLPLIKHFFFPGFTAATGGLLREAGLARHREAWLQDGDQTWGRLGLPQPHPDETSISLFCYENAALPGLLRTWSAGDLPIRCLVPAGRALAQAAACLGRPGLTSGDKVERGRLTLHALPFVAQQDYDRLLWSCDLNFVRGEDSFVRAQWAARPLVWHIYPQQDDAHRRKLSAFLDRYCADLPPPAAAALRAFWQNWNDGGDTAAAWPDYWRQRTELAAHARRWAEVQEKMPDLAAKLVNFIEQLV